MNEAIADRAADIVARTFGNTVNPVVTALMAAASVTTGHAELAGWAIPTGAVAGVIAEEAVMKARRAWMAEGVQHFADAVEQETDSKVEDLLVDLADDRPTRRLLGEAVEASAESADEWKISVLARAVVAGAKDGARVDEMRLLIEVLHDLDVADARALAAVTAANSRRLELDRLFQGIGKPYGEYDKIARMDQGIAHVLPLLVAKLTRLGFTFEDGHGVRTLPAGDTVVRLLNDLSSVPWAAEGDARETPPPAGDEVA